MAGCDMPAFSMKVSVTNVSNRVVRARQQVRRRVIGGCGEGDQRSQAVHRDQRQPAGRGVRHHGHASARQVIQQGEQGLGVIQRPCRAVPVCLWLPQCRANLMLVAGQLSANMAADKAGGAGDQQVMAGLRYKVCPRPERWGML